MPFKPSKPLVTSAGKIELSPREFDAVNQWMDRYKEDPSEPSGRPKDVLADILGRLLGHACGTMLPRNDGSFDTTGKPYRITVGAKTISITCLKCDMTSHNINDVVHRYCGNCHAFHEEQ